jgi:hypothetical protein
MQQQQHSYSSMILVNLLYMYYARREKVIRTSTLAASCVACGMSCNFPLWRWWMQILTASPFSLCIDSEVKYVNMGL